MKRRHAHLLIKVGIRRKVARFEEFLALFVVCRNQQSRYNRADFSYLGNDPLGFGLQGVRI